MDSVAEEEQRVRQRLRSCKRYEAWRNALVAFVLVVFLWSVTDSGSSVDGFALLRDVLFAAGVVASAWLLGVRSARVNAEAAARVRMEERLRLSRDVHDALSHSLGSIGVRAGVNAHVAGLNETDLRATLAEIEVEARTGIEELRKLLDRERGIANTEGLEGRKDPATTEWELQAELAEVLAGARKAGLEASLSFDSQVESLPSAYRTTLFRAVRELVTNVVRHASATSVDVAVRRVADGVSATVEDNGSGRVTGLVEGHGLTGVRERLALIGGQLCVADRAPCGIAMTVSAPIPVKRQEHQ